jgi:hypothetical protein
MARSFRLLVGLDRAGDKAIDAEPRSLILLGIQDSARPGGPEHRIPICGQMPELILGPAPDAIDLGIAVHLEPEVPQRLPSWIFVWTQQGSKLVGNDAVGTADQGISVALSGNGNTAIVGGSTDNSQIGAAWVYTRTGGVWTQQGSELVGTGAVGNGGGPSQGASVGLSADGDTAIVGGL